MMIRNDLDEKFLSLVLVVFILYRTQATKLCDMKIIEKLVI